MDGRNTYPVEITIREQPRTTCDRGPAALPAALLDVFKGHHLDRDVLEGRGGLFNSRAFFLLGSHDVRCWEDVNGRREASRPRQITAT